MEVDEVDVLNDMFIFSVQLVVFVIFFYFFYQFTYDRFLQHNSALLENYPLIGRMRYLLEFMREPMRQYFGSEDGFGNRDKIEWVYKAAKGKKNYISFALGTKTDEAKYILKHANFSLNDNEVSDDVSVTLGENIQHPFTSSSMVIRSAMSDGALSPEATRAFACAAAKERFLLNTGEGGLTSNFFESHSIPDTHDYLSTRSGKIWQQYLYRVADKLIGSIFATGLYRMMLLSKDERYRYILDHEKLVFFHPDWNAPLESFPKEVPEDIPDIILQIGSGLYGVRDLQGQFDEERYQKVMRFCRITEIKIAQGAKQTGGKLTGSKVSADIAFYRGVNAGIDLFSPNRFPLADNIDSFMDFIGTLKKLSEKPVGIKIVISDKDYLNTLLTAIRQRLDNGKAIIDFITVDSGEGGSATAPLAMMESVGLALDSSIFILDTMLKKHDLRDKIKIIASGKVMTPDDVIITLALGADMVSIGRAFMLSAGCIRARVCSGAEGRACPVGLATQDLGKRASFHVVEKSKNIASYHHHLISGVKELLAILGKKELNTLNINDLTYINKDGEIFYDVESYLHQKTHV